MILCTWIFIFKSNVTAEQLYVFVLRILVKAVCRFHVICMKNKKFLDFGAKVINFEKTGKKNTKGVKRIESWQYDSRLELHIEEKVVIIALYESAKYWASWCQTSSIKIHWNHPC